MKQVWCYISVGFGKWFTFLRGLKSNNECVNAPLSFGGAVGIGRVHSTSAVLFESNYRIGGLSDAHVMFAVVEWSVQLGRKSTIQLI